MLVALAAVVLAPAGSQAGHRPDASRISDAILDPSAADVGRRLRLVITDSYNPVVRPSRNVQVAEVSISPPS